MSTATITFEIDGQTVDALDASWYLIAPCGCADAVTVVTVAPPYRITPVLTEDDAWARFYSHRRGGAEHQRRDRAAGYTVELGRRGDVTRRMTECRHDPKWGTAVPAREGHTWAAASGTNRTHLVPGVYDRDARYVHGATFSEAYDAGEVTALCGKTARLWSTHWSEIGAPRCLRCEKEASR